MHEISRLRSSIAARANSLVDGLEGGELTKARLEELVAALGDAADGLLAEVGADAVPESGGERQAADGNAAERPGPYEGELPEGAPMARQPRVREARFAAVLMAIQGRERHDVEDHLSREFGVADCDQLLDDVFGRADATA